MASPVPAAVDAFDASELGLSEQTLRGVYAYGYEAPSDVQSKALPAILARRDVLLQARSGTGKTAAFGIALCEQAVRRRARVGSVDVPLGVVICHTRELAVQTAAVLCSLGEYAHARVATAIGGIPVRENAHALRNGTDIVVGTPGRLAALVDKQLLSLAQLEMFVIDEVDEVLKNTPTNAFLPLVQRLLGGVGNDDMHMVMVSATLPSSLRATTGPLLRNAVEILVDAKQLPLHGIDQRRVRCAWGDKLGLLTGLHLRATEIQTMVFCATRAGVDEVAAHLAARHLAVGALHGDMATADRAAVMRTFRRGGTTVLVSTDVLARGIDVQQVGLVVLFDMASSVETYLHCVGRCGRFGRKGRAVVLATEGDDAAVRSVEEFYGITLRDLEAL